MLAVGADYPWLWVTFNDHTHDARLSFDPDVLRRTGFNEGLRVPPFVIDTRMDPVTRQRSLSLAMSLLIDSSEIQGAWATELVAGDLSAVVAIPMDSDGDSWVREVGHLLGDNAFDRLTDAIRGFRDCPAIQGPALVEYLSDSMRSAVVVSTDPGSYTVVGTQLHTTLGPSPALVTRAASAEHFDSRRSAFARALELI